MTQTSPAATRQLEAIPVHRKSLSQRLRENWQLYVMLLDFFFLFKRTLL